MTQRFLGYLSLENFDISNSRKIRFTTELLLLVGILYLLQIDHEMVAASRLAQVLAVLLASHLVGNVARFFITTTYRRRHNIEVGEQDNFLLGIESLLLLFTILVTFGSIFPIYDIPVANFLTSLSLFSVAIVWGFHQYITNFFDGLRLMFSADFKIGDYIKVGEMPNGIVTHVNFRATRLRTDDGNVMFVPNTTILNTEVINFSKLKYKRVVVPFMVKRTEEAAIPVVKKTIIAALLDQYGEKVNDSKTDLKIERITADTIECSFVVSTHQYSFAFEEEIIQLINELVLTAVK